jgi:hypothetical protein
MINAQEARKESESVSNNENLKTIESRIIIATEKGSFFISFSDIILSNQDIKHLKENGYVLEFGQQYNESYTVIKW